MGDERSKGVLADPANRGGVQEDGFADLAETRRFAGAASRTTLWRWCRQGRFPKPQKLGPNRRGWRRSELRAWARDPEGWAAREAETPDDADALRGQDEARFPYPVHRAAGPTRRAAQPFRGGALAERGQRSAPTLAPDLAMARQFLTVLDAAADGFHFQTFADQKGLSEDGRRTPRPGTLRCARCAGGAAQRAQPPGRRHLRRHQRAGARQAAAQGLR